MINQEKIKELLQHVKDFKHLAEDYEDEHILDINHAIYDNILDEMQIEDSLNEREDYYEVFAAYELGQIDIDNVINKIILIKKG